MSSIEQHRKLVLSLAEVLGNGWSLLKFPSGESENALYTCNAGHIFAMEPRNFEEYLKCPICEIDDTINRKSLEYKAFMKNAKSKGNNQCALTEDPMNFDVHHIYSMRKFPEIAYHPANSILLSKSLHKDYHRYFSPYNTDGYTFIAWLKMSQRKFNLETAKIEEVIKDITMIMNVLEVEISRHRSTANLSTNAGVIEESIMDTKALMKMEKKAAKLLRKTDHGETIEIDDGKIILLNMYLSALIFYKNDFGNWIEYNPISGSISKYVHEQIMKA